jgi:heat shock protein HtpX
MANEHVAPPPAFAWTRVDQNRRATRVLTAVMVIALAPLAAAATIWIAPWGMLVVAMLASFWVPLQRIVLEGRPEELLRLQAGIFTAAFAIGSVGLTLIATWGIHRFAARIILARASARRVDPTNAARLCRIVDSLSIGAGLLAPDVHIIDSPVPNAFSTSRNTRRASLIVTSGLLNVLDERELENVVAHELSHIGNHDTRFETLAAGLTAILTLPLAVLLRLFAMHWMIGTAATLASLWFLSMVLSVAGTALSRELDDMPRILVWWTLAGVAVTLYTLVCAPVIGLTIRNAATRSRDFLADADTVLITQDPEGLALALAKVHDAQRPSSRSLLATSRLLFVTPRSRWAEWMGDGSLVDARINELISMGTGFDWTTIEGATRPSDEPASTTPPTGARQI